MPSVSSGRLPFTASSWGSSTLSTYTTVKPAKRCFWPLKWNRAPVLASMSTASVSYSAGVIWLETKRS